MNILIIGRKFEAISDVKTYTEMWAYNLACAFSEAGDNIAIPSSIFPWRRKPGGLC